MSGVQWVSHPIFVDAPFFGEPQVHARHWVPMSGTTWVSHPFLGYTHVQPRHWHPVARMHLSVPKKRVHKKKLGVTPIGCQTLAPSGARLPVFCALKCVYPKTPIGCQTLAPSGAHAPVGSQKKGASEKTGCDTHWVPDIGTQWRACTCFFGFTMCVSQKNGVTPIRCQTLAPSGAHAPVCPRKRGASKMS